MRRRQARTVPGHQSLHALRQLITVYTKENLTQGGGEVFRAVTLKTTVKYISLLQG